MVTVRYRTGTGAYQMDLGTVRYVSAGGSAVCYHSRTVLLHISNTHFIQEFLEEAIPRGG